MEQWAKSEFLCVWMNICCEARNVLGIYNIIIWSWETENWRLEVGDQLEDYYYGPHQQFPEPTFTLLCRPHRASVLFSYISPSQMASFYFILFIYLFIYLFLAVLGLRCRVFVAACGLSLVAASGGYSSLWCVGFSLQWLLLLWSTGSRRAGSVAVARVL